MISVRFRHSLAAGIWATKLAPRVIAYAGSPYYLVPELVLINRYCREKTGVGFATRSPTAQATLLVDGDLANNHISPTDLRVALVRKSGILGFPAEEMMLRGHDRRHQHN